MIDRESKPPAPAALPENPYAKATDPASPELEDLLRRRIDAGGPLDFADFMAAALYHPEAGYYARGTGQVGRGGDFFTSVSVGELFGGLLARRFLGWWLEAGSPASWRIIEGGAHDGTLAHDVLTALRGLSPEAFHSLEYAIPEPLARLRAAQQQKLAGFHDRVRVLEGVGPLAGRPLPGIVFGNEVIDALPCQVVEWRNGGWCLCRVGHRPGQGFHWVVVESPMNAGLARALARLGGDFPDGYRTEIRRQEVLVGFLEPLLAALDCGLMIWVDYGFARPEYHHPARTEGTLRAYARHRVAGDPLRNPGMADLTAHVEFTGLAEAAGALGARPLAFRDQAAWLTGLARPWLLEMENRPDPKAIRQFQTLTHPGQLGARFHVLELAWRDAAAPATSPSVRHRLALDEGGSPHAD